MEGEAGGRGGGGSRRGADLLVRGFELRCGVLLCQSIHSVTSSSLSPFSSHSRCTPAQITRHLRFFSQF